MLRRTALLVLVSVQMAAPAAPALAHHGASYAEYPVYGGSVRADGALLGLPDGLWAGLENARPTGTRFDTQAVYVGGYEIPTTWSTGYTRSAAVTPAGGVVRATDLYPDAGVAVQRWLASGLADTGFGADGEAVVDFAEEHATVSKVVGTAEGGALVSGYTQDAGSSVGRGFVLKLDAQGALDRSWGPQAEIPGVVRGVGGGMVLALTAQGGAVVSCYAPRSCLHRLTADGGLDLNFGGTGSAPSLPDVGDFAHLGAGTVNAEGSVTVLATDTAPGTRVKALISARYDAGGALVADVRTPLPCSGDYYCNTFVMAIEPAGQGRNWLLLKGDSAGVVLLQADGRPEPSFGSAGYARIDSNVVGMAVDGAGRLLVSASDGVVRHLILEPHVVPRVSVRPSLVKFGQTADVTIIGTPGATVDLYTRKYLGQFVKIRSRLRLDATGRVTVATKPAMNLRFLAKDLAVNQGSSIGGTNGLMVVEKRITLNVNRVGVNRFTYTGSISPTHPGAAVSLYRNGRLLRSGIPVNDSRVYAWTGTVPTGTATFHVTSPTTGYNNVSHSPPRSTRIY